MSIQRVNVDNSAERWESKDGIYVLYSDHLAETKRLREALEFYSNEWQHGAYGWEPTEDLRDDQGQIANKALASAEQQNTNKE